MGLGRIGPDGARGRSLRSVPVNGAPDGRDPCPERKIDRE